MPQATDQGRAEGLLEVNCHRVPGLDFGGGDRGSKDQE